MITFIERIHLWAWRKGYDYRQQQPNWRPPLWTRLLGLAGTWSGGFHDAEVEIDLAVEREQRGGV